MAEVRAHETDLTGYALEGLKSIAGIRVYGPLDLEKRSGVLAFSVEHGDSHLVAQLLNDEGIAVRAGGHCAYPLADRLGVEGTVRASFYVYNTRNEVDRFLNVLDDVLQHRLV
jgi:cysteine desulfurase/selenocysteine lyase